jgi:hypothetical protein
MAVCAEEIAADQ